MQDGKYFLLPKAENEVKVQLNRVLPLVDELDVLFNQWSANEQKKYMVAAMNDELAGTQAAINNNRAMYSQLDRNAYIAKSQRADLDQQGAMLPPVFQPGPEQSRCGAELDRGPGHPEAAPRQGRQGAARSSSRPTTR